MFRNTTKDPNILYIDREREIIIHINDAHFQYLKKKTITNK